MDAFTMLFWVIGLVLAGVALKTQKANTVAAIGKTRVMMGSMIGEIVAIIFLIGLVLAIIPPEKIKLVLGGEHTLLATIGAAFAGSITLIPAFVAFPLVGSIIKAGASLMPAVAFLTTLTMVGVVTFPLEAKAFGMRFTLYRNGLSFAAAILIALIMGFTMQGGI